MTEGKTREAIVQSLYHRLALDIDDSTLKRWISEVREKLLSDAPLLRDELEVLVRKIYGRRYGLFTSGSYFAEIATPENIQALRDFLLKVSGSPCPISPVTVNRSSDGGPIPSSSGSASAESFTLHVWLSIAAGCVVMIATLLDVYQASPGIGPNKWIGGIIVGLVANGSGLLVFSFLLHFLPTVLPQASESTVSKAISRSVSAIFAFLFSLWLGVAPQSRILVDQLASGFLQAVSGTMAIIFICISAHLFWKKLRAYLT